MNKEIKFRAWDKELNKMCDVVTIHCAKPYYDTCYELEYEDNGKYPKNTYSVLEDKCEVMQYTGLKDKNGKEIYEGDIIAFPDTESEYVDVGIGGQGVKVAETEINSFGTIVFYNSAFVLDVKYTGERLNAGMYTFLGLNDNEGLEEGDIEIIGNIYENSELLKAN